MTTLSENLEQTLHQAFSFAASMHHEYATLEHLLLALCEDNDAVKVLKGCKVQILALKHDLSDHLKNELTTIKNLTPKETSEPKPTAAFQRVVQRAAIHVQSSEKEVVTGANILVAIFAEDESYAVYCLHAQQMSRFDATSFISHGTINIDASIGVTHRNLKKMITQKTNLMTMHMALHKKKMMTKTLKPLLSVIVII